MPLKSGKLRLEKLKRIKFFRVTLQKPISLFMRVRLSPLIQRMS